MAKEFCKNDIVAVGVIGSYAALLFLLIADALRSDIGIVSFVATHPLRWLLLAFVPGLGATLLYMFYRIGRWRVRRTWFQIGKFLAVSWGSFFVDLGVLSFLIVTTGAVAGVGFAVIKSTSFVLAVVHSYGWNRYWTFAESPRGAMRKEFSMFLLVMVLGLIINVAVASLMVNTVPVPSEFSPRVWATIAAFVAAVVGFLWNFFGARRLVFERHGIGGGSPQSTKQTW